MHGWAWLTLEFSIVYKAGLCKLLCLSSLMEPCCGHSSTFPGLRGEKKQSGLELREVTQQIKSTRNVNYTTCWYDKGFINNLEGNIF